MKQLLYGTLGVLGATTEWWKEGAAAMYQVYPRSFQDTCPGPLCDGTGDLPGIISRLQYLVDNGVGYVWLSPVMRSPMKDFGYDISDYRAVDPLFGSMEDLDNLIKEMHEKGLKIILDLVPNHTSEDHPWFIESRSNTTNSKRDWYIWKNASDAQGSPPNNWVSNFGGSAWTYDNTTNQSYYHAFGTFQPDLNYRNPEVIAAIEEILEFWFNKSIDGFRVDAVPFLLEDPDLKDEPPGTDYGNLTHIYTQNWEGIHNITQGWRTVSDKYDSRALIGEVYAPLNITMEYYGNGSNEFHFPFNFQLISPDVASPAKFIPIMKDYFAALPKGAWPNWVVGNHDNPRIMSKLNNDTDLQKGLLTMLHMLPGTIVTYYGDELAMKDTFIPYDKCKDPSCINNPDDFVKKGRDPERTPMQWNCSLNGGFSLFNDTWLPLAPDYCQTNVQEQEKNISSVLTLYRRLLGFRRNHPHILVGEINFLDDACNDSDAVAFRTSFNNSTPLFVLVNLGVKNISCQLNSTALGVSEGLIQFASDVTRVAPIIFSAISLGSGEALVLRTGNPPTPAPVITDWDTIRIALIIGGSFVVVGCVAILCIWQTKRRPADTYDRIKEGRA